MRANRNSPAQLIATLLCLAAPAFALGAELPTDFILQEGRAGLVRIGMSRQALQESTYDRGWMKPSFLDQHRNSVDIYLPGDPRADATRSRAGSMTVNMDGNRPDGGEVTQVYVQDPRFRTAEGLGPGCTLGDIRALHPDLVIQHEVVYESFDGMKAGEALAEVHHPHTEINGVRFLLRPANYLKYRPADGLPDDTPVVMVRVAR